MHRITRLGSVLLAVGLFIHAPARAEWFGSVGATSDNIERGTSQSDRKPSVNAQLGVRHAAGAYARLGIASVSDTQYAGSDGYKLIPEVGWNFFDLGASKDWRAGVSLRGQVFPGARGTWYGSLPPRLQALAAQPEASDYGTLEVGASLGWKIVTLSVSRSLTDYLGLSATQTGPAGTKVIDSRGTTHLGIDIDWPLNDTLSLFAGAGRLHVPNFDGLGYADWRLGAALQTGALRWTLQASGSDADATLYRLRNRSGGASAGDAALSVSASLSF